MTCGGFLEASCRPLIPASIRRVASQGNRSLHPHFQSGLQRRMLSHVQITTFAVYLCYYLLLMTSDFTLSRPTWIPTLENEKQTSTSGRNLSSQRHTG
jgi:hypothetical protein